MGKRYDNELLCQAIEKYRGLITPAAKAVGCDPGVFHRRVKERSLEGDEFRQRFDAARIGLVDTAECKLLEQVEAGNITAIIFTLKCIGYRRGWIDRIESRKVILNLDLTVEDLKAMTDEQWDEYYNEQLRGITSSVVDAECRKRKTPAKKRKGTYLGPPGANGNGQDNNGEVLPP